MKKTTKAFTLVEMLIVIVIIGILIASLMPRMQSAQGRARDVARKNDLSQIQTAIITSQQDRGAWPGTSENPGVDKDGATTTTDAKAANIGGLKISDIADNLQKAGMSSIPTDPNSSNVVYGLGDFNSPSGEDTFSEGDYIYFVTKRNAVEDGGFILMAKTEVEGSSNYITCQTKSPTDTQAGGYITSATDLKDVKICEQVSKDTTCDVSKCKYSDNAELRYILMY